MNNAKTMLSIKKPPQLEKTISLKGVSSKNKKNDKKKIESTTSNPIESTTFLQVDSKTLPELNETSAKNSTNFDLDEEFTNMLKLFIGDLIKKTVEERLDQKNNKLVEEKVEQIKNDTSKETLLSAKNNKEHENLDVLKIEESTTNSTEQTRQIKNEDKDIPVRTYRRPVYIDEPLKKYKLILIDGSDAVEILPKKNSADRFTSLRSKKLKEVNDENEDFRSSGK